METRHKLLTQVDRKRTKLAAAVSDVIKKRDKKHYNYWYKKYKESNYDYTLHPCRHQREDEMDPAERQGEWVETRANVVLLRDWGEHYDLCLSQLVDSDKERRNAALISLLFALRLSYPDEWSTFEDKLNETFASEDSKSPLLAALRRIFLSADKGGGTQKDTKGGGQQTELEERVVVILILSILCGYVKNASLRIHSIFSPMLWQIASDRLVCDDDDEVTEKESEYRPCANHSLELRCSALELIGELLFFNCVETLERRQGKSVEVVEEELYQDMQTILRDFVIPTKGNSNFYPICSLALSVFAFLITLFSPSWVFNFFTDCFELFRELLDHPDLHVRLNVGECFGLLFIMNDNEEDRFELDPHDSYSLVTRMMELSQERDAEFSSDENMLQWNCFQTILLMLQEQDWICAHVSELRKTFSVPEDEEGSLFTSCELLLSRQIDYETNMHAHVVNIGKEIFAEDKLRKGASPPQQYLIVNGWRACKQLRMFYQLFPNLSDLTANEVIHPFVKQWAEDSDMEVRYRAGRKELETGSNWPKSDRLGNDNKKSALRKGKRAAADFSPEEKGVRFRGNYRAKSFNLMKYRLMPLSNLPSLSRIPTNLKPKARERR